MLLIASVFKLLELVYMITGDRPRCPPTLLVDGSRPGDQEQHIGRRGRLAWRCRDEVLVAEGRELLGQGSRHLLQASLGRRVVCRGNGCE